MPPKYKDCVLPLLFYKRLSKVHEDEPRGQRQEFGNEALALLAQAEEARAEADAELGAVLARLGFGNWRET